MDIEPVVNPQDIIFLSASVPHRPEWVADSKPAEIEEAIISLARAVFARGAFAVRGPPERFAVDRGRSGRIFSRKSFASNQAGDHVSVQLFSRPLAGRNLGDVSHGLDNDPVDAAGDAKWRSEPRQQS